MSVRNEGCRVRGAVSVRNEGCSVRSRGVQCEE